jgi:hypothetical protein
VDRPDRDRQKGRGVNLARLEHRLEHAEKALLRVGLVREREPEEPPPLAVLLEAATDEELVRLEEAAETSDDVAQTLAGIARRLDEERPAFAARSPLEAAVAVERARRRGDLDVETLVSVLPRLLRL